MQAKNDKWVVCRVCIAQWGLLGAALVVQSDIVDGCILSYRKKCTRKIIIKICLNLWCQTWQRLFCNIKAVSWSVLLLHSHDSESQHWHVGSESSFTQLWCEIFQWFSGVYGKDVSPDPELALCHASCRPNLPVGPQTEENVSLLAGNLAVQCIYRTLSTATNT